MNFGAKVVIILEKKRILYLQFGYLALFRLVIWLNNIWSFGFLPLSPIPFSFYPPFLINLFLMRRLKVQMARM